MASFRPDYTAPIPNSTFSAPLNPYVIGPWWPEPVGAGLSVDLTTGTLSSTGGGGGGGLVFGTYPILANTSVSGVTVSIAPGTISSSGAVQLTSSLNNTSQTLALTAAAGKSLQDQINALVLGSTAGSVLIGTIDGSTGLVSTIVNNTYPGFTVGSPLPAAAPVNVGTFVLVTIPGTMTPPNGVSTVTAEGDWWYSDGVSWTLIPVGTIGSSALPATVSSYGTVYACTPDYFGMGSTPYPVVALGRQFADPFDIGTFPTPCGGNMVIGTSSGIDYTGSYGQYGAVVIGNLSIARENSVLIGGCSCVYTGGSIAIGNYTRVLQTPFVDKCGGIAIGNQLDVMSGGIGIITSAKGCTAGLFTRNAVGVRNVIIGSKDCLSSSLADREDVVSIGTQRIQTFMPNCSVSIGACALEDARYLSALPLISCGEPVAIGRAALSGLRWGGCAGLGNTAVGTAAGVAIGSGSYNTYLGNGAGTGVYCNSVVVGSFAAADRTADDSVVLGAKAAQLGPGPHSVIIGSNAGPVRCLSFGNIIIGSYAGKDLCTLTCLNLIVGTGQCFNAPSPSASCQLALGFNPTGSATSCYWLTGCADKSIRPGAGIVDANGSTGTNGQVLSSSGANTVVWSSGNSLPAGALMNFAMAAAPSGWLVANGDTVPNGPGTVQGVTANFADLYAAVGNLYGGPGRLPDMRGMFARGWDSAGGTARNCDPGRALGSQQGFALQNITGSIQGISETFGLTSSPFAPTPGNALYRSAVGPSCGFTPAASDSSDAGTMCFNASLSACTAAETRPVNVAVLPCIKY
jgi:hypothetical protein